MCRRCDLLYSNPQSARERSSAHDPSRGVSVVVGVRLPVARNQALHLPTTDVGLELTSADVIHSFWIAGMKDAVERPFQARRTRLI
jgi:hypothetical protein